MTDRLTDLMVRETDALDVPPPPAAAVLTRGRGLRRRRRAVAGGLAVASAAAVVVAALSVLAPGPSTDVTAVDPTAGPSSTVLTDLGAVFAIGGTVYLDDGRVRAEVSSPSVRSISFTSVGLLVQGTGAGGLSLVEPDGSVRPLDVPDAALATDADQPLVAWTESVGGVVTVRALDVSTGERVAEVALPDHSGDFAPAALDGDSVFVGDGDRAWRVDLATGAVTRSDIVQYVDELHGGRTNIGYGNRPRVVDVESGRTLLRAELPRGTSGFFALSPDGRFARLVDQTDGATAPTVAVYDVSTGRSVELPNVPGYGYGWTADGRLTSLDRDGVLSICSPVTGRCATSTPKLDVRPYEHSTVDCDNPFVRGCTPVSTGDPDDEDPTDDLVLAGGGGWS